MKDDASLKMPAVAGVDHDPAWAGQASREAGRLRAGLACPVSIGAAHGLLYPSLAAIVAERSAVARRGRALTAFNAAFNTGCGLSLLSSGSIAARWGYPSVFLLVGVVTLASVTLLSGSAVRTK